jgi:hypothetical protein
LENKTLEAFTGPSCKDKGDWKFGFWN